MDFHEVYERYAASVQRFAYWLCQDEQMAQDLTSETFTRAWLRLDHLREPTLRAYLFAITRNLYLADRRRHRREVDLPESLRAANQPLHTITEAADHMAWLQLALSQLSERERSALLLRSQEELSYAEIAATLKISLSAAKVTVHRARLKLFMARAEQENT
ncbi:MAG: sigma-70 family RNA polymerase sigma factor [Anaerolineales bacterium]|nr:MAG: sigma-70 family RNA polymerase sigma factor [Anaerolineales bacterium]